MIYIKNINYFCCGGDIFACWGGRYKDCVNILQPIWIWHTAHAANFTPYCGLAQKCGFELQKRAAANCKPEFTLQILVRHDFVLLLLEMKLSKICESVWFVFSIVVAALHSEMLEMHTFFRNGGVNVVKHVSCQLTVSSVYTVN